jgi:hypothetical protein
MNPQKINRICAITPVILSLLACVWVLGNVSGGVHPGSDEGLGFYIFWLFILAQVPFIIGYLITADWKRHSRAVTAIALQVAALVLAFAPIAYFNL